MGKPVFMIVHDMPESFIWWEVDVQGPYGFLMQNLLQLTTVFWKHQIYKKAKQQIYKKAKDRPLNPYIKPIKRIGL